MTNLGLEIDAYVIENNMAIIGPVVVLPCRQAKQAHRLLGICCNRLAYDRILRRPYFNTVAIDRQKIASIRPSTIYLATNVFAVQDWKSVHTSTNSSDSIWDFRGILRTLPVGVDIKPADVFSAGSYEAETRILKIRRGGNAIHVGQLNYLVFYGDGLVASLQVARGIEGGINKATAEVTGNLISWCQAAPQREVQFQHERPKIPNLVDSQKYRVEISQHAVVMTIGPQRHSVFPIDIYDVSTETASARDSPK
jgi:hypothetical protein